jgi:hypothetical protein
MAGWQYRIRFSRNQRVVSRNKVCHETGDFTEIGLTVLIMPKVVLTSDQSLSNYKAQSLSKFRESKGTRKFMTLNDDLHAPTALTPDSNITWYKRITGLMDLIPGLGTAEQKDL